MKYVTVLLVCSMVISTFIKPATGEERENFDAKIIDIGGMFIDGNWYCEGVTQILSSFDLAEPDEFTKPSQYRVLISPDDLADIPDGFSVFAVTSRVGFSASEPKTVVHAKEPVSYEILFRKMDTALPNGYISLKIHIMYSKSQKEAFQSIFADMLNSSMPIEDIVGSYGKSPEYQLGEICLVSPPPEELPTDNRGKICFVRDCTAFVVLDNGNAGFDVSALARYLDKKYAELTEELNNPPALRQWKVPDEMEAKYISSTDKEVTLEKKEGGTIEVELSKLSKQDQLYVQRRVEIARYEAEEKTNSPETLVVPVDAPPLPATIPPAFVNSQHRFQCHAVKSIFHIALLVE